MPEYRSRTIWRNHLAMLRQFLNGTIVLSLCFGWSPLGWAIPDQTMSVTPSATSGSTILAADENTRNSNISTPFNAHSHTDITQTATPLNIGASSGRSSIGDSSVVLEGATNDASETTISVTDPTADRTFTIPNETAAAMVSSLTTNATDAANSVTGASNALVFEGATADAFETTITVTDPTADRTITIPNATGTVSLTSQRFVGNFTRDTSLASGTQAITGVGFQPTAIWFFAIQGSTVEASWGMDDGTNRASVASNGGITADTYDRSTTDSIFDIESSGNTYAGRVSSFDSDGFTVSWTRTGTPTGSLSTHYIAIR